MSCDVAYPRFGELFNQAKSSSAIPEGHVPNNLVLGIWVLASIVQVLVKYVIIGYLTLKACSQTEPQISLQGFRGHIGCA